jgi:hypothetical protein
MQDIPYLNAIGALMYLSLTTRPDISYAVGICARYGRNPGQQHWQAVKHIFRYLQKTRALKLTYKPVQPTSTPSPLAPDQVLPLTSTGEYFQTYSDADHARCLDTGHSTGGFCVIAAGGAVSWSSHRQGVTALSSTKAEYLAAVEAGKELIWMRSLVHEFEYPMTNSSTLHIDNQSTIAVTKNPEKQSKMKQIRLSQFWLRDTVESGEITPQYTPTTEMIADIFTKPLARVKIEEFRRMLGLE